MSCSRATNKVAGTVGVRAGISALQSKFSSTGGRLVGSISAGLGRSATTTLAVTESFDGPSSLAGLETVPLVLEAGLLLASLRGRRHPDLPAWANRWLKERDRSAGNGPAVSGKRQDDPDYAAGRVRRRAWLALGLLKLGQSASILGGTGLARLSRRQESGVMAGVEQRFFFPNSTKLPVRIWPSRLTPLLNQLDCGRSRPVRSDGVMLEIKGLSWHRGTVVVKTSQGERTITHLQSLSWPSTHYFFDRRLSDNEAVGVISSQKGFEPKSLPGYAGQVSEVEALFPTWAGLKRGLIQAHLRWGRLEAGEPQQEGVAVAPNTQAAADQIHPLDGLPARVTLNGQEYPVLVRRVVADPARQPLAEATYFDEQAGVWKAVEDQATRARLADQVRAGLIEPWETGEASSL